MLRFTTLFNFGLVGALIAPAALQQGSSTEQLEKSISSTDQALGLMAQIEVGLAAGNYSAVESILRATEAPLGEARKRSELLDLLRQEIGQLEFQMQQMNIPVELDHLNEDPTTAIPDGPRAMGVGTGAVTPGLTNEERSDVELVWPPVPGANLQGVAQAGTNRFRFEKEGFTVDAVSQGRAYYRAKRYTEALRLFLVRAGEPEADYWIGRTLERLGRTQEAIAAYTEVVDSDESGPLGERAATDRDFLNWSIEFNRKLDAFKPDNGEQK